MFIHAKKKLEFSNPATGETFATKVDELTDAPDWIEKDPLFSWAVKEGSLTAAEHEPVFAVPEAMKEKEPAEPNEEKVTATSRKKPARAKEADAQ